MVSLARGPDYDLLAVWSAASAGCRVLQGVRSLCTPAEWSSEYAGIHGAFAAIATWAPLRARRSFPEFQCIRVSGDFERSDTFDGVASSRAGCRLGILIISSHAGTLSSGLGQRSNLSDLLAGVGAGFVLISLLLTWYSVTITPLGVQFFE